MGSAVGRRHLGLLVGRFAVGRRLVGRSERLVRHRLSAVGRLVGLPNGTYLVPRVHLIIRLPGVPTTKDVEQV